MNIKPLHYLALTATAILLTACSTTASKPVPANAAVAVPSEIIRNTVTGAVSFTDDRSRKIFATVVSSPKLTASLNDALAADGFNVVHARGEADVVLEIDGAFQALRPATQRTAEVRLGDYMEHPAPVKTKGARRATVVGGDPFTMILGTIIANAMSATGGSDSFNEATVGDPDGKCLASCEGWLYNQRASINIKRIERQAEQKLAVITEVTAEGLQPAELFQRAILDAGNITGLKLDGVIGVFKQPTNKQVAIGETRP